MTSINVRLQKVSALSDADWTNAHVWRDASAIYNDPMFEPGLSTLIDRVRQDLQIMRICEAGETIGFWPILLRPGGWARPFLGPFSDWHGPILDPDYVETVKVSVILRNSSLLGATFPAVPAALASEAEREKSESAIANYSDGWDSYLADQTAAYAKHFKKMRRLERKIDREIADPLFTLDDKSEDAFEWLINTKQDQYSGTGRHNVLKAEWATHFLDSLRRFETPRFKTRLSTLRFDGSLVAAEFNMWSDRVLHGWITAINPDFRSFSPGYLLMQWVMQKSAEEGVELSDLGPGQLDYKKFYTNEFAPLGTYTGKIPGKLRPLGDLWVVAERFAPDRLSRIMTKIRRRSDQICASEPVWQERLAGHANALLKNRP